MATLLPQSKPGESGDNCKMPSGCGVEGELPRARPLGLAVVAGTIAFPRSEAASVISGLQFVSSHTVSNILAALCWPLV